MDKRNIEAITSLSPAQQGMLYETIRTPGSGIHVEQFIATLTGELDVAAFERAWQWGVDRHAILRTGFVWKGQVEPLQVTLDHVPVTLDYQDWRGISAVEQHLRVESYLGEVRVREFDLAHPPLMHLKLFQLDEKIYRFIWTLHHILMDGWSHTVLLNEIMACYAAYSRGLAFNLEPSRPYRDYIAWLKKQDVAEAEQFWRKTLCGFAVPTRLGREQERATPAPLKDRYESLRFQLSNTVTTALQSVVSRHHLTLNTVLQGIWAVLLGRYSETEDVIFGITVSGRPADLVGVETMVGLYINTLPLRVQLPAQASLWAWFEELQRQNVEIHRYEYCSAGDIHRWSDVPGRSLLYESLLVVENYPMNTQAETLVDVGAIEVNDTRSVGARTKYALTFLVAGGAELRIQCVYDAQRFERSSIEHILGHFQRALHYVVSDPQVQLAQLSSLIPLDQLPIVYPALTLVQTKAVMSDQTPRGPIEEIVAAVWCDVLGLGQVGVESNFFALGGHSLIATQMIARLRVVLRVEVPLRVVFEYPTVAGLAQWVERALRKREGGELTPLERVPRPEALPLSFAQRRLWFLDQLEPGSTAYLTVQAQRLLGDLNPKALERSLQELVCRHESLRTTFEQRTDQPVQVIHPIGHVAVPVVDLQGLLPDHREREMGNLTRHEAQHPMCLSTGPLLRISLLRLRMQEHVLLLTLHHIITDGWSNGVLVHELTTLYRARVSGLPSPLAPLPIQYADYVLWQQRWLQGEVLQRQVAYWKKQLWQAKTLELPTDPPDDTSQEAAAGQEDRGVVHAFWFPLKLSEELVQLSRQEGVTLFMLLLAAFQILLYRLTGQTDIVVGTDVANRTFVETEQLIGFFVNLLALRTEIRGTLSFRESLQQIRPMVLDAYAHQEVSFDMVIDEIYLDRKNIKTPLIRALCVLQNVPKSEVDLPGITIEPVQGESPRAKFDLALFLHEGVQGLGGSVVYRAALFKEQTIATLIRRLEILLKNAVVRPDTPVDELEISTDEEKIEQANSEKELYRTGRKHWRKSKSNAIDVSNIQFRHMEQRKERKR